MKIEVRTDNLQERKQTDIVVEADNWANVTVSVGKKAITFIVRHLKNDKIKVHCTKGKGKEVIKELALKEKRG